MGATFGRSAYAFSFVSLLLIALVNGKGLLVKVFRWSALRELGKVSYCMYVIHPMVMWSLFRGLDHGDEPHFDSWKSIALTLPAFATTLLLAELSWRFFEGPMIRRGHRYFY